MGISKLYQSTDASAPTLLDTQGYLIPVLDAVLVNGYGSKTGLGWTKEYASPDGKIVCYRNKGTGFFLKVSNSINYAATGTAAMIEAFEAMGAWDKGYLRCPEDGVNHYFTYANTKVGSRAIKWKIIGDDKGFWICTQYSTNVDLWSCSYFGDYTTYHLQDVSNWINVAQTTIEVGDNNIFQRTANVNTHNRIVRDNNNNIRNCQVVLWGGFGTGDTNTGGQLGLASYASSTSNITSPVNLFSKPLIGLKNTNLYTVLGEICGLVGCINWIPSNTIVKINNAKEIHVFWTLNGGKIGIIVGEGFRP